MKHRILKLAALAFAAIAILFVAFWAGSLPNDPKSAQLAFGKDSSYACLALGKGNLILCDHFDNREVIRLMDRHVPMRPGVANDMRAALPGFTFRHVTLASGQRIWCLELSLLIVAIQMAFLAGLFFWILRSGVVSNPGSIKKSMQRTDNLLDRIERERRLAPVFF